MADNNEDITALLIQMRKKDNESQTETPQKASIHKPLIPRTDTLSLMDREKEQKRAYIRFLKGSSRRLGR